MALNGFGILRRIRCLEWGKRSLETKGRLVGLVIALIPGRMEHGVCV